MKTTKLFAEKTGLNEYELNIIFFCSSYKLDINQIVFFFMELTTVKVSYTCSFTNTQKYLQNRNVKQGGLLMTE